MKQICFSATMATVATMIVTPGNHRRIVTVTVNAGPQITVAIVATVAPPFSQPPSPKRIRRSCFGRQRERSRFFPSAVVGDSRSHTGSPTGGGSVKRHVFMKSAPADRARSAISLGEPTALCSPRDESVIVGYYTSRRMCSPGTRPRIAL